MSKSGRH